MVTRLRTGQRMRVCISRIEKPIGVPYGRQATDPKSHGYVNLRENPEQIALIPEIHDWPELESTLRELNRTDSPFQTLGCEKAEIHPNDGSHGVSGYVDIAFVDLAIAQRWDIHLRLFQIFQQQMVAQWPGEATSVEFVMQPTQWIELQQSSWSFSVWVVVGNCRTETAAKEEWSATLKIVREFLLSSELSGFVASC
jgi:hypothetical protein